LALFFLEHCSDRPLAPSFISVFSDWALQVSTYEFAVDSSVCLERWLFGKSASFRLRGKPNHLILCYLVRGRLAGFVGERPIRSVSHQIAFLLDSGEVLDVQVSGGTTLQLICWDGFPCPIQDWSNRSGLMSGEHDGLIFACCQELLRSHGGGARPARIRQLRYQLERTILDLITLLSEPISAGLRPPSLPGCASIELFMERILVYIDGHLSGPLCVKALSAAIGLSERRLQQICRDQMGVTPRQLLKERRLLALREYLQDGIPLRQACQLSGLVLGGKLAAAYRAAFGELPSQTSRASAIS
jgi:AraC-like DNA-binding protein